MAQNSNGMMPRAADELFKHFEGLIREGALTPGTPLPPEREIVAQHGVSRTVVREALLALANKGLIDARPRFRPVVAKPNYDTAFQVVGNVIEQLIRQEGGVRNLFDTRIMMEAALVREAALHATSEHIRALEAALKANGSAVEDSDLFYETDVAFHGALYAVPGNPVLPAIHKAYTDWLSFHWRKMPRLPDRNRQNHQSHVRIFEAILRRDADQAETALRDHLDDAWQQVKLILEASVSSAEITEDT